MPFPAFDGPLDLLLDEVRRQKIAIEDVALAPLVSRYLAYLRTAASRNFTLDMEWLHMAATLIDWKSRSLLPSDPALPSPPDPIRDDLVRQLLAHRKEIAQELSRRRAHEQTQLSRDAASGVSQDAAANDPEDLPFVSVWDLMQQARDISRWVQQYQENREQWREALATESGDDVTVSEMIDYLLAQLNGVDRKVDGAVLIQEQPTASRRSCLFLGILEMARDQRLQIEQTEEFGPLWLA